MSSRIPRRGSVYYVQQAVPKDLQAALGCKQIWKSLGTKDYDEAKTRHLKAKVAFREEFKALRLRLGSQSTTDAPPAAFAFTADEAEALAGNERYWIEREAELEANPILAAEARYAAMLRKKVDDQEFQAELRAEEAASNPVSKGTRLAAVVDSWAASNKPDQKQVDRMSAVVSWFEDHLGRLPVEAITADNVLTFRDKLLAKTGASNARTKLRNLNTLLRHAKAQRLIRENPAADISVTVKADPEDARTIFDHAALEAVFGSPVFTAGARPKAGGGEAAYWLPLLGLYTGARLNELGQLRPSDVFEQTYFDPEGAERRAWVIRITADREAGLKLKNAQSARHVPVHADLIALGFLDYVASQKGAARIFPLLTPDKYGHVTANWSKWFGRYLRTTCGVKDERIVFHSFRHSFKHYARQAFIPKEEHDALTGHMGKDVGDTYGAGAGFPLVRLVNAMAKYRIPGFKLPPRAA